MHTDKANILNQKFKSVFTPKTPLTLNQLSRMAVQDLVDNGKLHPSQIPSETLFCSPNVKHHSLPEWHIETIKGPQPPQDHRT